MKWKMETVFQSLNMYKHTHMHASGVVLQCPLFGKAGHQL